MLAMVLNWISGGLLDKVLGFIGQRRDAQIAAMSEERQIEHRQKLAARQAAKEIRLATAGFWEMRLLTFLIAFPFVAHLWAVWIDTQWPQPWNVEAFPEPFHEWQGAILLSFFGVAGLTGVGRAVAGSIALRRR